MVGEMWEIWEVWRLGDLGDLRDVVGLELLMRQRTYHFAFSYFGRYVFLLSHV